MDQCEGGKLPSSIFKNSKEEVDIVAKINQKEVMCPYCKSNKLTNKGKTPKTGEYRMCCALCNKSFATIIGIEFHSLNNKASNANIMIQNEEKINTKIDIKDKIENVLRNSNISKPQYKKLNFLYFKNCTANKTGDVRRLIIEVTNVNNNRLFNIDFANDDLMELCCSISDNELIVEELKKLTLVEVRYNPASNDEDYKSFIVRITRISKRRNIKPLLKRFIEYTMSQSKQDLNTKYSKETAVSEAVSNKNEHLLNE